jgi:hypothetical protein
MRRSLPPTATTMPLAINGVGFLTERGNLTKTSLNAGT